MSCSNRKAIHHILYYSKTEVYLHTLCHHFTLFTSLPSTLSCTTLTSLTITLHILSLSPLSLSLTSGPQGDVGSEAVTHSERAPCSGAQSLWQPPECHARDLQCASNHKWHYVSHYTLYMPSGQSAGLLSRKQLVLIFQKVGSITCSTLREIQ